MKARVGLVVAVVAAAVIALIWWMRGSGDAADEQADSGSAVSKLPRTGKDPVTGAPLWLAQDAAGKRRIAGTVLLEGAPVSGVTVRLASRASIAGLYAEPHVVSDATGRFDFGPQLATAYTVVAEKPKSTGAQLRVDLRDPNVLPDQLTLVLHACEASIYGAVRDTSGGPIAKARVAQSDDGIALGAGVDADDNGAYELCVPVGGAGVLVSADGYAHSAAQLAITTRMRRDFALVPEAIVAGRVVRAGDRAPVAGAIVEIRAFTGPDGPPPRSAATDDEGRFRIDGARPGRFEARAKASGMATARPTAVIAEVGTGEELTLVLEPTVTIAGKVIEKGTAKGVSGLRVTAYRGDDRTAWLEAVTQADGSFVLDHASTGEYVLFADNYERGTSKATVTSTDVTGVVLEIDPVASIAGRVIRDGKPVDGAMVRAERTATRTDADGRFVLRALTAGEYQLYAESKRLGAFTQGPKIEVKAGEQRTGVDIDLDLSGSIDGVVVDQNGKPVAGVFLQFTLLQGRDFGQATTAEDGRFTVKALSGGGDYRYEVRPALGSPIVYPPVEGKRHPAVAVRDGKSHVTDLKVQIKYERLAITGRVLSTAGQPIPDVVVQADPGSRYAWSTPTATTDTNGAFAIRDLPAGNYTVRATSPRGSDTIKGVTAGRNDVVLKLAEPGAIEGTLEGFSGSVEIYAWRSDSQDRYRMSSTGTAFQFKSVAPGTYRVTAQSPNGTAMETVVVASGAVAKVVLKRPAQGSIEGTVVDEANKPVAGATCYSRNSSGMINTDATGSFRFATVSVGEAEVDCGGPSGFGSGKVTVNEGQTARLQLTIKGRNPIPDPDGDLGMEVDMKLDDLVVTSVKAGGAAQRAGITVGDTIVEVNGEAVSSRGYRSLTDGTKGSTVKLTIEHDNKQRVVELKFD